MTVLQAHELYKFYHAGEEETLALRGVSLDVTAGEMVAVMGPSGSGKSTLLSCLAGLDEPDGGYVQILDHRLTRRPETERATLRARYLGLMMQTGNLFDHLTVEENIRLSMQLAAKVDPRRITELLATVGLLPRLDAYPAEISGGEAARAALAVALAVAPPILLADEPTGEVDADTEGQVLALMTKYCRSGGAALIVTHSDALAGQADRVIRLEDGRVMNDE